MMQRWLVVMLGGWLWGLLPLTAMAGGATQLILRDYKVLPSQTIQGVQLSELSGLAWDADEQLLYAISDKGRLFHFRLRITGNHIDEVSAVYAANLTDLEGERVKKGRRDSEGLTVINANNGKHGDTQLVISFEGDPRIIRFTPQGQAIKNITLPPTLNNIRQYRYGNNGLESVTFHPRYGFLTAPELPLRGQEKNIHTIYAMNGQRWFFPAYPADNSGISALETLPDGNLLVLERAWSGLLSPLTVSLRYLDMQHCSAKKLCPVRNLQVLSSHLFIDNYEGLTHIKGNQYLMVSDDGDETLLTTTLALFTLD